MPYLHSNKTALKKYRRLRGVFTRDGAVHVENREKYREHQGPQNKPERAEKHNSTEDREKYKNRGNGKRLPEHIRRQYIIHKRYHRESEDRESDRPEHTPFEVEIRDRG